LTFAIENESAESLNFYQELVDYTAPRYETSVRQNAIISVLTINPTDQTVMKNLVNATTHYKWQFSKFGRDKIRELLPKENFRKLFELLLPELKENEKLQLQRLLDEKL
jgi:aminopeptidase N